METQAGSNTGRDGYVDVPIQPVALHARGGEVFLGARQRRDGVLEIIYERVGRRRSVWQVRSGAVGLQEACRRAINAEDSLATLYAALKSGGIRLECVEERFMR